MSSFKGNLLVNKFANELCDENSLGKIFHINSKQSKHILMENMFLSKNLINNPEFNKMTRAPEKSYPNTNLIELNTVLDEDSELISILRERRSRSTASEKKKISLKDLSLLSWAGYGVVGPDKFFRTAPSAGALYPCELYMLSLNTELEQGLYHYRPSKHNLEVLKVTDINLDELFLSNAGLESVSAIFVMTSVFDRSYFKYGERSYRFALLEAGAMAQNIGLVSTKLGYHATPHGGASDIDLEKFIGIDGKTESIVHIVAINN